MAGITEEVNEYNSNDINRTEHADSFVGSEDGKLADIPQISSAVAKDLD